MARVYFALAYKIIRGASPRKENIAGVSILQSKILSFLRHSAKRREDARFASYPPSAGEPLRVLLSAGVPR